MLREDLLPREMTTKKHKLFGYCAEPDLRGLRRFKGKRQKAVRVAMNLHPVLVFGSRRLCDAWHRSLRKLSLT